MALLSRMLFKRRFLSFIAIGASGLTAAVTLWWNAQLSRIINVVSMGMLPSKDMIAWALVTMLMMGAANYAKAYVSGYVCEGMAHDLRMGYARHFASLPVAELEKMNAGKQLSALQNEIAGVSGYLNGNLFQLFDDGIRFTATLFWLFCINPSLTLVSYLPGLLIVAYAFWSSKRISSATEHSQKAKVHMNQYADTLLTLFPIIRLYDAARMTREGYANAVKIWEDRTVQAEQVKARLMSLSGLLQSIPLMLLFLAGGRMTFHGALSVGTLYIFLNLSGNVSGMMMNMPGYIAEFRQFAVCIKRLSPYVLLDEGD